MEEPQVIIIYRTYSEAQKRANKKYAEKNKDKLNNHMKNYYNKKKETDPDYMQKRRDQSKKSYYKKKLLLQSNDQIF